MTLRERIAGWILKGTKKDNESISRAVRLVISEKGRGVSGRISVDTTTDASLNGLTSLVPFAPDDSLQFWRDYNLDSSTLDRVSTTRLAELLADVSPEVSRALWDFLRFCNPGYEIKCYRKGSEEVDKNITQTAKDFISILDSYYGSFDVVLGRLFLSGFLRGSIVAEMVLDNSGMIDLATPDPSSIRFEKQADVVRGSVWKMYQWQGGKQIYLDSPTISYVPIDPLPGSPYGRALVAPALFTSLFMIGLLHDLRRVISQQGYPRLDLEIIIEKLKEIMPESIQGDAEKMKAWINDTIQEAIDRYAELEPDDAYVHLDAIKVNRPVGAVDASSLGAVDGIIMALERMATRALKSNPLLMGTTEGTSEANANRQWEIHAASIKAIQHHCEKLLERLFEVGLRAQGIEAKVEFRFAELRASELQRDEIVQALKLKNARMAYDNGLISQDEQADMALGKPTADQTEPRAQTTNPSLTPDSGMVPDPGSNRINKGIRGRSVTWEGLELSRYPTELEKRVVKPIARVFENQKKSVEQVLLDERDKLIEQAVDMLEDLNTSEYHTIVLSAPRDAIKDVNNALRTAYREGRELVADELGVDLRSGVMTIGENGHAKHYRFDGRDTYYFVRSTNDIEDADEDVLQRYAELTVSRIINEVQSRASTIASKLSLLYEKGKSLWDKVREELKSTSVGYISVASQEAANAAVGLGRSAEMTERENEIDYYIHSEILDNRTCDACREVDGIESENLADLPNAPYEECDGGSLCRGFNVAVYKL